MKYNYLKKYKTFINSMRDKYIKIPNINDTYIPQGVSQIDNNILITYYDYTKKNNSIIYLYNIDTKEERIITLDGIYHCGSISYHIPSNSIYIPGNSSYINKYNYQDILTKDKISYTKTFKVDNNNSLRSSISNKSSVAYLSIYKDELYLGNFSHKKGIIKKYIIDKEGNIEENNYTLLINPYKDTQGICKYYYNNEEYYIFSTSYTRFKDSTLYITKLINNTFKTIKKIKLPPMSEQINTNNKELYILFESNSKVYKNSLNKVADICYLDFEKLLN